MSTLDRLRGIVHGRSPVPVIAPEFREPPADRAHHDAAASTRAALILGGAVLERSEGTVIVVEREYGSHMNHGRLPIGDITGVINDGGDALALMAQAWPAFALRATAGKPESELRASAELPAQHGRLLFFDLETTGLFGGAGTQAFLVGCAAIDGEAIRIRQFLLPGFEHERAVLAELKAWAAGHGALVSYNGRTFDVPLVETRFLFNRLPCPLEGLPHLDMLHAARRLWRRRPTTAGPDPDDESCSLAVLEKHIAGVHRVGDVPGYEIPSRFFRFVRDGDARPLEAVLEHNRLDLLSLAAMLARAITLITRGPDAATTAQEAYGLARVYERAGALDNAEAALLRTIDFARRVGVEPEVHADALRRLAWLRRRARRMHDAADAWMQLASLPRCAASLRREATEALAIHHEHRSKNLEAARQHALALLADYDANPARVRHRLERLERKLTRYTASLPIGD